MLGVQIGIKDIIDILLSAFIMFEAYRLLRRSGAANLFWGIFAFIAVWILVTYVFQLSLTGALFDRIISVGAIALLIIFQEEIRTFFYSLGARFSQLRFLQPDYKKRATDSDIQELMTACHHMSASHTGALIVLAGNSELKEYADSGEIIDAVISARMIENIFFKNTPLHDGALIIKNNRLAQAACILPVSRRMDLPKHYGLRHRAALGLAEKSDSYIIVVSEETGFISVAHNEEIKEVDDAELVRIINIAFH